MGPCWGESQAHVTKLMRLDMAQHWEMIRFIVGPMMTEFIILVLAWLDKWGPYDMVGRWVPQAEDRDRS